MKFNPFICWPVTLYYFISIGSILATLFISKKRLQENGIQSRITYIIGQIIILIIGTAILNALCYNKYFKTAWVLLLLPAICLFTTVYLQLKIENFNQNNNKFCDKKCRQKMRS